MSQMFRCRLSIHFGSAQYEQTVYLPFVPVQGMYLQNVGEDKLFLVVEEVHWFMDAEEFVISFDELHSAPVGSDWTKLPG